MPTLGLAPKRKYAGFGTGQYSNVPMPWGPSGAPTDYAKTLGLAPGRVGQQTYSTATGVPGIHYADLRFHPGPNTVPNPPLGLSTEPATASYAQRVRTGVTPFTNEAAGARFAAANDRIAAATAPIPEPGANRLTGPRLLGIASGRYASTGKPSTVGLGLAMRQAAGREGSAMNEFDGDRLTSRLKDPTNLSLGLAPVREGEGVLTEGGPDLKTRMPVAKARLDAAYDRRHYGFEPSASGVSPQEAYDMRQFEKLKAERQLRADRQAGKVQTPRQVRTARAAEAQQRAFEQSLGLASPGAYAQLQQGRGAQALAKSQFDATQLGLSEDRKLRRDALTQQGQLAIEREKAATDRARLNAAATVAAHGGDPIAVPGLGLATPAAGALPKAEQEFRATAIEDPEKAVALRVAQGKTTAEAQAEVKQLNPDYGKSSYQAIVNSPLGEGLGNDPLIQAIHGILGGVGLNGQAPPSIGLSQKRPITHEDLIDKPGDNAAQRAARARLRRKYTGMATQNAMRGS